MMRRATSSHICPGPNLGYRNCSISEVSVPFWPMSPPLPLNTFRKACISVDQTERPLMRWAPHSALIRLHGTPQTFSV